MKILVIVGHPREKSFSDAVADAFVESAREAGAEVRLLLLRDLEFNANVVTPKETQQWVEPDLERARQWLLWCDQIVFVYPTWWASVPALLKGFLDRVLTAGFAFEETTGGTGYRGLLGPRSARIITTMDTPKWAYRWIYGRPGTLAMAGGTLGFCGLSPVRVTTFAEVKHTSLETRTKWLQQVRDLGRQSARGATLFERASAMTVVWLQAMRLQFYPMSFLAYAAGASGASHVQQVALAWTPFWFGYLSLFCIEVASVFANDIFDFESDRRNQFHGPFTGGSRVLVDRCLSRTALRIGSILAATLGAIAGLVAISSTTGSSAIKLLIFIVLSVLAIGYTVPPLRLSHRGLGELDVCFTHSFGVILWGFVLQDGAWLSSFPWLLGLPLFCAIFPAILLAGIPDIEADRAANKWTLVARLGTLWTLRLSFVLTVLAIVLGLIWSRFKCAQAAYVGLGWVAVPVGCWLLWRLSGEIEQLGKSKRMDSTIAVALLFIFVFAIFIAAALTIRAFPVTNP